jgi:hypothetical protein
MVLRITRMYVKDRSVWFVTPVSVKGFQLPLGDG